VDLLTLPESHLGMTDIDSHFMGRESGSPKPSQDAPGFSTARNALFLLQHFLAYQQCRAQRIALVTSSQRKDFSNSLRQKVLMALSFHEKAPKKGGGTFSSFIFQAIPAEIFSVKSIFKKGAFLWERISVGAAP
jgi:hypothetical protein